MEIFIQYPCLVARSIDHNPTGELSLAKTYEDGRVNVTIYDSKGIAYPEIPSYPTSNLTQICQNCPFYKRYGDVNIEKNVCKPSTEYIKTKRGYIHGVVAEVPDSNAPPTKILKRVKPWPDTLFKKQI